MKHFCALLFSLILFSQAAFSQNCTDGTCPTQITSTPVDVATTRLMVVGLCPEVIVTWTVQGIGTFTDDFSVDVQFPSFGQYTASASFIDQDCGPNPVTINGNVGYCPDEIKATQLDCNVYEFTVENIPGDHIHLEWTFNPVIIGQPVIYTFNTPSVNSIRVNVSSSVCPLYQIVMPLNIPDCGNADCPDHIILEPQNLCYHQVASLGDYAIPSTVAWQLNNQPNTTSTSNEIAIDFPDYGNFLITAFVTNSYCTSGVQLMAITSVPYCNMVECPTQLVASTTDICGTYEFITTDWNASANSTWTLDQTTIEAPSTFTHAFTHFGTQEACVHYVSDGCTFGTDLCTTINIPICHDGICTGQFTSLETSPNHFTFSFAQIEPGTQVTWNFGDGTPAVTAVGPIQHIYQIGGSYFVSAQFNDVDCTLPAVLRTSPVFASGPVAVCPTVLSQLNTNCGSFVFTLENAQPNSQITWNFGDGTPVVIGTGTIFHHYNYPGYTDLLVTYSDPLCPSTTIGTHVSIDNCNPSEICPTSFDLASTPTCGAFNMGVSEITEGQTFQWNFNDGSSISEVSNTSFQFPEAGTYTVCLLTSSTLCPTGTMLCQNAIVPACNYNCNLDVVVTNQHCGGDVYLVANNAPSNASITWSVNNNDLGYGHLFSEQLNAGTYAVCARYEYSDCTSQITNCENVTITECSEPICPQLIGVSNNPLTCGLYDVTLSMGILGEEVAWTLNGNPLESTSALINIELEGGTVHTLCADYYSIQCPAGVHLCQDVNAILCNDCPSTINITYQNCVDAIFSVGNQSVPATVLWNFGDGVSFPLGSSAGHNFAGSDIYTVTANYSSYVCPQGSIATVDITIVNCLPECLLPITVAYQDCSTLQIGAVPTPSELPVTWYIDGVPSGTGENRTFNLPTGPHAVCATITDDLCPSGYTRCRQIQIDDCAVLGCPQDVLIQALDSCQGFSFAIAGNGDNENILWNFGDDTVVQAGHNIQHFYPQGGTYEMSVSYSSSHCTGGITLTETLVVDACPIPCEINVAVIDQSCEFVSLQAITQASNIIWNVDGQDAGTGINFSSALSPGTHAVTATYNDQACLVHSQSSTLNIDIAICTVPCSITLTTLTPSCELGHFNLNVSPADMVYNWTANQNPIIPTANNDLVLPAGIFNVCVSSDDPHCSSAVSACTPAIIEACPTYDCPSSMTISSMSECQSYLFSLGLPGGTVAWNFGDGNFATDLSVTTHHYNFPGTYTVQANYTGPECSVGASFSQTIVVNPCPQPCSLSLELIQQTCEHIIVQAHVDQINDVSWQIDNTNFSSGDIFTAAIPEGNHDVCAIYNNIGCASAITECLNLDIAPCPLNCSNVDMTLSNNVPTNITYWIEDINAQAQSIGSISLNGSQSVIASNCLDTGCYKLILSSATGELNSNQFLLNLNGSAGAITFVEEYTTSDSLRISFGVNQECAAAPQCQITLQATEVEPCMFSFEAFGTPEVYPMHWNFGDGFTTDATWLYTYQFEPGDHTVCVMVEDQACGPVTACVDVTCTPVCSNTQLVLTSNVATGGTTGAAYTLTDSDGNIIPTNGFAAFDNQNTTGGFSTCLINGCYDILLDSTLPIEAGSGLGINLIVDGFSVIDAATITTIDEYSMNIHFGVNSPCLPELPFCAPDFTYATTANAGEITFTNGSVYNGDAVYFWTFGDGTTSTEISPSHVYASNGNYTTCLQITTTLGCINQVCQSITVTNAAPGCSANSVLLTISGTYTIAGSDLLHLEIATDLGVVFNSWTFTLADGQDTTISLCLTDLCYRLVLSKINGNIVADGFTISTVLNNFPQPDNTFSADSMPYHTVLAVNLFCDGVAEIALPTIHVYPNPAANTLTISSDESSAMEIQLYDMMGRLVKKAKSNSNTEQLDVNAYSNGIYQLRIIQKGQARQYKVEILH